MKKYLLAATGAMALSFSANANAALVFNITGAAGSYGNTNVTCSGPAPCAFSNSFTFAKPAGYQLVGATIISIAESDATNIDFTSVTLNGFAFAIASTGIFEARNISSQALGNWNTISVQGLSGGNASYSGTLSFAAVPEPSTWLMMILGVGIAGAALRRRRQTVKVSYA